MNNDSKARFSDPDLWIRLLYMILFAALTWLSRLVLCVIGLLQFLVVLINGAENRSLRDFSASLAEWTLRAFRFICFNSEQKPFPFDEWPEPESALPAETIGGAPGSDDTAAGHAVQTVVTETDDGVTEVETTVVDVEISEIETSSTDVEDAPFTDAESEGKDSDTDLPPKL